jgi:hypothetical protein
MHDQRILRNTPHMRAIAIGICLAACGGAPMLVKPPPTAKPPHPVVEADRPPVDPIAALTPDDAAEVSWIVPGPIQLELGGTPIPAAGTRKPIEVGPIDRQGNLERVAIRLEYARFSVWIDHAHMLSVITRDQRIDPLGVPGTGGDAQVVLRAGAMVRRLAHRDRSTEVRYLGALQIEGWVPNTALSDRGHPRDTTGRIPTGRKPLMVIPGAVIRTEPRWAAGELAIMASGYILDTLREFDDAWTEVSYEDGDVAVHGFVSRRDPPGRVHRWHEPDGIPMVMPNAAVASGTCLYARPGGEPIGYIVGSRPVDLDDTGDDWWTLTIDTPWGPLPFAAHGPARTDLTICAPPGALPPATP